MLDIIINENEELEVSLPRENAAGYLDAVAYLEGIVTLGGGGPVSKDKAAAWRVMLQDGGVVLPIGGKHFTIYYVGEKDCSPCLGIVGSVANNYDLGRVWKLKEGDSLEKLGAWKTVTFHPLSLSHFLDPTPVPAAAPFWVGVPDAIRAS